MVVLDLAGMIVIVPNIGTALSVEFDMTHQLEAVFSPAYLKHVCMSLTSLQFRILFDVGIVLIHKLLCGHSLPPNYALLLCLKISLGRRLPRLLLL